MDVMLTKLMLSLPFLRDSRTRMTLFLVITVVSMALLSESDNLDRIPLENFFMTDLCPHSKMSWATFMCYEFFVTPFSLM